MFHDGGVNVYAYMPLPLTIERFLASHFSRFYERKEHSATTIAVIVVTGALYVRV